MFNNYKIHSSNIILHILYQIISLSFFHLISKYSMYISFLHNSL